MFHYHKKGNDKNNYNNQLAYLTNTKFKLFFSGAFRYFCTIRYEMVSYFYKKKGNFTLIVKKY